MSKIGTTIKRILKVILWLTLGLALLFVVIIVLIQIPSIQTKIIHQVTSVISQKTSTRVEIDRISITYAGAVVVNGLFLNDNQADTLLYAGKAKITISFKDLLFNKININYFLLENTTLIINRAANDSLYNFNFLIAAFSDTTKKVEVELPAKPKWAFDVKNVRLNNIKVDFDDAFGGINAQANLSKLNLAVNEIDLKESKYSIANLQIDNLVASVILQKSTKTDTKDSDVVLPRISASKIRINNSSVSYIDSVNKQELVALISLLELTTGAVDLQNETVSADKIALSKSTILFNAAGKSEQIVSTKLAGNALPKKTNWVVAAQQIELVDNSVAYNVANTPVSVNGFNSNHMDYKQLNLDASKLYYSSKITKITVNKFSTVDRLGFSINQFETEFSMDQHSITATKLVVRTPNSSIDADLNLKFGSLQSLKDSLEHLRLNLDLQNVSIANSDIVYFSNQLVNKPFFQNKTSVTTITGKVNGLVKNLTGKNLVIKTGANTIVKTDFIIKGLPKAETAYFSIPNLSIVTGKADIEMMAGTFIPISIELPENISTQISFNGTLKAFESDIKLNSSFGSANVVASIDNDENFKSKADINKFDLGSLLRDTVMFGPLWLTAEANGKGLDINTIEAKITAEVTEIFLNGYNYQNLILDGDASGKEFAGLVSLNDKNIAFDFDGRINLNPNRERYKFNLNFKGANLQKLHFTKDDIRVGLTATADLEGETLNKLNGKAGISNIVVVRGDKVYELDSLLFASINESGKSELNFSSALVGIKYSGTLSPINLVAEITAFANRYFPFTDSTQVATKREPSNFNLEIQLHNHPILSQVLLPQLNEFEPGIIKGSFDSEKNQLILYAAMNRIVYGSTEVNDLVLDISSDSTQLVYEISSSAVSSTQVRLDNVLIEGKISDSIIQANLSSIDQNLRKKVAINSQIGKINGRYRFAINKDNFYLMHNRWNIAEDNFIEFGKAGMLIHNFFIESASSKINVSSVNNTFNEDINIEIIDFKLDDLSRIVEKDTSLVKGKLNGNILMKRVNNSYGIIADAKIDSLAIRNIPIGNITAKADNPTGKRFDVNLDLSGEHNRLSVNGFFLAKEDNNPINLKIDIQTLSLEAVEALSMGQIKNSSGSIAAKFAIKGTFNEPEIAGKLVFNDVLLTPTATNNRLELKNETIQIRPNGIFFNAFTLLDSHKHSAVVDGSIKMTRFKDFIFALQVNTNNFQLINTSSRDNREFFGRMIIDSRINIKGPIAFPEISARVKLKNGSNFTFAVPESRIESDKGEGVVKFKKTQRLNPILYSIDDISPQSTRFTGIDLSSVIEIDKQATLKLLLDPLSSDSLVVRGEAGLSFSMDRSGKMSLTGAYHLDDGSYLVSLESIVKRRFDILSGSTIVWNGDPLDAIISINAKYTARAAPYDLMAFQMSALSDTESSSYKQRYPFWVLLKLRGELLHPTIDFEIQLPPEDKGILGGAVNQKLSMLNEDESALNKQVFALLVLGRFIQENPLQAETGGTSTLVRATVGKLLSAQLNQLSSKLISGVELDFDVQSFNDYQTGEAEGRTQVEVGVKKQLFNNRLSVQVGGSVDVEGESAKQNKASEITGDVKIEYALTKDGRYRLKGFRHNQYEGALEGQLIETGVGVAFVRDFNKWKNLFRRKRTRRDPSNTKPMHEEN
jgi:hypothetical protein